MGASTAGGEPSEAGDVDRMTDSSIDEILRTLSDTHRRRLLELLRERDALCDSDVPEAVHTGEEELSALQVSIYHIHLPHLEEEGFIDWDRDESKVAQGPKFDEIVPFLRLIDVHINDG